VPLYEGVCVFMLMFHLINFRMKYVSGKSLQRKSKHMFSNVPEKSFRLWDNVGKYGRATLATDASIIRRMRIACRKTKATDTHSECVLLIAFPRQQRLCANVAHCYVHTNVTCLVFLMLMSCKVFGSDMVAWWAMIPGGASGPYWGRGAVLGADVELLLPSHVVWFTVWPCMCSRL